MQIVYEALGMPLVPKLTYPYIKFPSIDDMMSLHCGRFFFLGK